MREQHRIYSHSKFCLRNLILNDLFSIIGLRVHLFKKIHDTSYVATIFFERICLLGVSSFVLNADGISSPGFYLFWSQWVLVSFYFTFINLKKQKKIQEG